MPRVNALKSIGTGNSLVNYPLEKAKILSETPINQKQVNAFISAIGETDIKVILSNRVTKHQFGTCWNYKRRINLYNTRFGRSGQTEWTFLHELAHVISHWKYENGKKEYLWNIKGHGKEFARSFEMLLDLWVDFKTENPDLFPPHYKMVKKEDFSNAYIVFK